MAQDKRGRAYEFTSRFDYRRTTGIGRAAAVIFAQVKEHVWLGPVVEMSKDKS
jgi:hypothetical protein